jgi:hypothetical protein
MTRYSDAVKVAALAALVAHGGNIRAAARAAGVSARTLGRWVQEVPHPAASLPPEFREGGQSPHPPAPSPSGRGGDGSSVSGRGTLEERLASAIDQFVDGLPDKLDEANLQQSVRLLLWLLDHYMTKPEAQVSDARERLGHLLDRIAAESDARLDPEGVDGG